MTLYEQILTTLRTRLASIPGLGLAGVMRGDTFSPEREQLDGGAAIDIADGTLKLASTRKDCEWLLQASPQIRITAATEAERDRVLDLAGIVPIVPT